MTQFKTTAISFFCALATLWLAGSHNHANAAEDTVLTVVVNVGDTNSEVEYSLRDLLEFEPQQIVTENDFVDGLKTFTGPLAKDLLAGVTPADNATVRLTAVNEYQVEFPVIDFFEFDVIFATHMDGKPLSRRDKGPLWVIYPMSDQAELRDNKYNARLIWQLVKVEVN